MMHLPDPERHKETVVYERIFDGWLIKMGDTVRFAPTLEEAVSLGGLVVLSRYEKVIEAHERMVKRIEEGKPI